MTVYQVNSTLLRRTLQIRHHLAEACFAGHRPGQLVQGEEGLGGSLASLVPGTEDGGSFHVTVGDKPIIGTK